MKKFLSLVLALVMTMSLVTIGAGATEYKNLSDKGEIQYSEAVAVLNKLGIITGYEDGSFKPTGALTRGAAAKIIVSLMIGSEAASNLTVAAAPYKDVATSNTFAAVISYCKTAGYINGYTDGTFRPTASLTGYAFSKMLLGALGYDGVQEGFTGSGWTMNVAKLGNTSGLFNDFATAFSGNAGVTREGACLLALNTLKATEVQYTGGTNITTTTGNATTNVSTQKERSYVTSNNTKINANIKGQDQGNNSAYLTLQFGEEHFTDLKLTSEGNAKDDFGRPSNEWSYKSSKIGTYAQTADKTYTTGANGDTDADMVKDMGLKDYKVSPSYYTENGKEIKFTSTTTAGKLAEIANLTSSGVLVEVYLDDDNADTIDAVVVIKTQMMQVNAVKSSEVTLKKLDDTLQNPGSKQSDVTFMSVNSVKDDDDCYASLKGLKADDYVLVVPVLDGSSYKVDSVAIPQTVTGKLTNIATKTGNTKVKSITVAGTAYSMSNMWTSDDNKLSVTTKLSNTKDTTVYLDTYGYAIFVKDVSDSNSAIIIDGITSSVVDGKIVKYATGWDTKGDALSINIGNTVKTYTAAGVGTTVADESTLEGKVFEYQTTTSNNADYKLIDNTVTYAAGSLVYAVASSSIVNGQIGATVGGLPVNFASDVKIIFESIDDGDVTGITVHEGVTEVHKGTPTTLYYVLNDKGDKIVSVIVPDDDDSANTANLLYVQKVTGYTNNTDGKRVALFTAYIDGEKVTDCQYSKESLDGNAFYTYSKNETTGVYTLSAYNEAAKYEKTSAVVTGWTLSETSSDDYFTGKYALKGSTNKVLNAKDAVVIDLDTDDGTTYTSVKSMKEAIGHDTDADTGNKVTSFKVSYIYNGSDNTGAGKVSYVFITDTMSSGAVVVTGNYSSVVDTTVATANGLNNLDMSAYTISGTYAITMNVVASQNLQTQVKEFLTYKSYTNIGTMSWNATSSRYEITATNPDGIVVTLTLAAPSAANTFALVTVGTAKYYVDSNTTVAVATGIAATAYSKLSGGTYALGSDLVVNGTTYGTTAYQKVTVTANAATSNGVTYTLGGTATQYVESGVAAAAGTATFTVTVSGTDGVAAGTATVTTTGVTAAVTGTVANVTATPAAGSVGLASAGTSAGAVSGTFTGTVNNLTADLTITIA